MRVYVIRRILKAIPTLLLITLIAFMLIHIHPGAAVASINKERLLISNPGPELTVDDYNEIFGFNDPLLVQYGRWLGVVPQKTGEYSGLLQGDLGQSLWKRWTHGASSY
ncbi:hypothetical protein ACFLYN_00995 [Chloroflexota bacterium]